MQHCGSRPYPATGGTDYPQESGIADTSRRGHGALRVAGLNLAVSAEASAYRVGDKEEVGGGGKNYQLSSVAKILDSLSD